MKYQNLNEFRTIGHFDDIPQQTAAPAGAVVARREPVTTYTKAPRPGCGHCGKATAASKWVLGYFYFICGVDVVADAVGVSQQCIVIENVKWQTGQTTRKYAKNNLSINKIRELMWMYFCFCRVEAADLFFFSCFYNEPKDSKFRNFSRSDHHFCDRPSWSRRRSISVSEPS